MTVELGKQRLHVLIVSATVGAGDAGNARELARRLEAEGHDVHTRDFLDAAPLGVGKALSKGYEAELKHAPWAYEAAFRVWFYLPFLLVPLARLLSFFTRKRILAWVKESQADVVVSTYPIATQVLGDLRRRANRRWLKRRSLRGPAVNFITDFGYHPFWAHPDIDLNLAVHPDTVVAVGLRTGRASVACAPLVGPGFATAASRRPWYRHQMGLESGELAVLISSGSWGVGAIQETFELVAHRPGLVPVVACGRNDRLRHHLAELTAAKGYRAVVLGWTDDMPGLMAACDVLVENAGGLTSLEAMAAGLPMVNFQPIPGHGRNSAAAMTSAGVSHWAADSAELMDQLELLGRPGPARQRQLGAAAVLFSSDPAGSVAAMAACGPLPKPRLRPVARAARAAYGAALAGTMGWFGLTAGVGVAASATGLGVAHPPAGALDAVYLGARLNPDELASASVQAAMARLGATAVVSACVAESDPSALRNLVDQGTDVESGGLGSSPGAPGGPRAPWAQALADTRSVQVVSFLAGRPVDIVVPNRSVSAFDLVDAGSDHLMMVVPNQDLPTSRLVGDSTRVTLPVLQHHQIYLINGYHLTPAQLVAVLVSTANRLNHEGLVSAPFSELR